MMKTKELKKEIFPHPFIAILPKRCEDCGADIETTLTFTRMRCSNEMCKGRIAYRMRELLRQQGITYVGEDAVKDFIERNSIKSPYYIYLYNPKYNGLFGGDMGKEESERLFSDINKRRGMVLWEYVLRGCEEELRMYIPKILREYRELSDFYADMELGGVAFVQDCILEGTAHMGKEGMVVRAAKLYDYFAKERRFLETGLKGIVLLKPELVYSVFFANKPEGYESTYAFVRDANKMYEADDLRFVEIETPKGANIVYWKRKEKDEETTRVRGLRKKGCKIVEDIGELRGM